MTIKLRVTLGIGFANSNQEELLEIDDDEWNDCETEEQRGELKEQYWKDWANNYIDGGYWVEGDE